MSVQTSYGFATTKGIAGGIYDLYHYNVETRNNEANDGALKPGMGVVRGTAAGNQVKLPVADSTFAQFEGVVVNGYTNEQNVNGVASIKNKAAVGVMQKGKIWVVLADSVTPAYGDPVYVSVASADAGKFYAASGANRVQIDAKFIGSASDGIAPIELNGNTNIADSVGATTLAGLTDVDLSTAATNGQVLKYNTTTSKWEPAADAVE